MNQTIRRLRLLGFIEAISLLVLLFIAMPLKYVAGMPEAVKIVGNIHGMLFLLYLTAAGLAVKETRWSRGMLVFACLIASVPFGPFLFDRKLFPSK